jgi:murein DD-endopeptidase MepM/ murein hydrolase activator NlpD
MPKKQKHKYDKHFLITISDQRGARHFKIPKFVKPTLIGISLSAAFALTASNVLVFSQRGELEQTKSQANELEDAFVKLRSKNSSLNKTLNLNNTDKEVMSEVLTQMEQLSGVGTGINTGIIDRLTIISDYFTSKELDFDELDGRVSMLEESIGRDNDNENNNDNAALKERIELASLNITQQKILHDSIPNGYPTDNTGVTSTFGKRVHPTTNQSGFHNGIDLKATEGTDVYATADGVIKQAAYNKLSGKRIILSHNLGFESRYAHLSEMTVKPGDVVHKGDIIGLSGNTGRSDGPHLHYEIRYLDKAHNPINFMKWEFGNQEIFTKVRGIQWQSLISLINKQISRPTLQLSQVALKLKAQ